MDLTKILLFEVGPPSRLLEPVCRLVLVCPVSQGFLQLFLLFLFVRPLLCDLFNQLTIWPSGLSASLYSFILRNNHAKVVDGRLRPGEESLQLDL